MEGTQRALGEPGRRHPTLHWNEPFARSEHGHNWILERWTVRERAAPLLGPDPRTLIDPISPDALKTAVRARLAEWGAWTEEPEGGWPLVYTVETMCRALYTLEHATLSSKPGAVAWALATLGEPWRATVERSEAWKAGAAFDRAVAEREVLELVRWVAGRAR